MTGLGQVGAVVVRPGIKALVTGVSATGYAGQVTLFLWTGVLPNQNPAFSSIAPIQSSGYNPVNPSQSASWVPVVT